MPDAAVVAVACVAIAVFGGVVKGTMGVGLPLVAVPMLALFIPPAQAIGLLVMPVLLSNLWQAIEGGALLVSLRRFGSLIAVQFVATVLTVRQTRNLPAEVLNALLALAVLLAVLRMAMRPGGQIAPRHQGWTGAVVGAAAGFLGGVSSLTGPMVITYLMALRLDREAFIGSISIIYLCGALPMYGAMLWYERFGWPVVGWSFLIMAPVFLGLQVGKRIRHRISEALFRQLLLGFLCLLAILLLAK